jgi:2-dehydropantoate 2-reductase
MKIVVLGAGSLGCAMGGLLANKGHDVGLVNHNAALVAHINTHGLWLRSGHGEKQVRVRAATNCTAFEPPDLLLVLVKSFDTERAIQSAAPTLHEDTTVLSLQNGLGHEEVLAAAVGQARVLIGRTYVGGQLTAPGVVTVGAEGKDTFIGELGAPSSARAVAIGKVLTQAGMQTRVSPDIMAVVWDKLLVNVATGALSGITRLPYGGLYSLPELQACAEAAVQEAMAVAQAQGIALSFSSAHEPWFKAGKGLPAGFKASMLQSLENGKRTEIDFINGAVVRLGERLGIPTPVNRALVAAIKGIELAHNYTAPSDLAFSA